jgi:type II secretion system protein C
MKSAKKNRAVSSPHAASREQQTPRRPWPLIALGIAGFALVVVVGINRTQQSVTPAKPESKVYSAATDSFQPMAVTSTQTGKIEPPGIAKPLRLFAVTPGSSSRSGLAVLGAAEASSRTYVAGALLENGARLTEIHSDHVVLVRASKNYTLYLPQTGRSDQLADTRGLTVGDFPREQPPLTQPQMRVSDFVRVAPFYEGTQIAGYSVYPGSRTAQFERWGLKAGDVLVSLGGQPLATTEQMESLLDQLTQGVTLTGKVRRGDQLVAVTLDAGA